VTEHRITTELTSDGIHVHLDNCAINIMRTDEGVVVDIWEPDFEGAECVATTYAFDTELFKHEDNA
jgi:hypothetical protein